MSPVAHDRLAGTADAARGTRCVGRRGRRRDRSQPRCLSRPTRSPSGRRAAMHAARTALVERPAAAGRRPGHGASRAGLRERISSRLVSSDCSPRSRATTRAGAPRLRPTPTPFVVGEMLAVLRGSAPVHVSRTGPRSGGDGRGCRRRRRGDAGPAAVAGRDRRGRRPRRGGRRHRACGPPRAGPAGPRGRGRGRRGHRGRHRRARGPPRTSAISWARSTADPRRSS